VEVQGNSRLRIRIPSHFIKKNARATSIKYNTYSSNSMFMDPDSPLLRFKRSMTIDYEKWHDGIGYDLTALEETSAEERGQIEAILLNQKPLDWRDIEALSVIDSPKARRVLRQAVSDSNLEVRLAVTQYVPQLISSSDHTRVIIDALRWADIFGGLAQALDQVVEFHPPEVVSELFKGVLARKGDVAVLFAAMLSYIYGKSDDPFDMSQRLFFLRFNTEVSAERNEAFLELCEKIGVNPKVYL
jgi:hypothetical protein